jgi:hypothetical protein
LYRKLKIKILLLTLKSKPMYGIKDLKQEIKIEKNSVECPVKILFNKSRTSRKNF